MHVILREAALKTLKGKVAKKDQAVRLTAVFSHG